MANFLEKKTYTKLSKSKIMLLLLVIIIFVLIRGVWGVYKKERETSRNLETAQRELQELEEREKTLTEDVSFLRTQKGVETEIRKKFDVAQESEKVIVLINPKDDGEEDSQDKNGGAWNWIKNLFGFN